MKTPSWIGDGIDNDCDGRIDEELCNGRGLYFHNLFIKYFSNIFIYIMILLNTSI